MKNRNPYLSVLILWIGAICVALTSCVFGIVTGVLWQSLFNLCLVVLDSVYLGCSICKFNSYREFVNSMKEMEEKIERLGGLCCKGEDLPFKEFDDNGKQ